MKKYYYHITENDDKIINSILSNGLTCDEEGNIFLFENKSIKGYDVVNTVADCIANNQIFVKEYAMFEIDSKGITSELIQDEVAELTYKLQWIAKQQKIESKYIDLFNIYKTSYKVFIPHQYRSI